MKHRTSAPKIALSLLMFFLAPSLMFAVDAVVDCTGATPGAFTTVTAALASLPKAGPNSVSVVGACHEAVQVFDRTDVTIFGNPTATILPPITNPSARLLFINAAKKVNVRDITFDGGSGIFVNDESRVNFINITVQNSVEVGISSQNSLVIIADSTVQNNTQSGISIRGGAFSIFGHNTGATVTGNGNNGITAATTHLFLVGSDGTTPGTKNVFSNNTGVGVFVANSSEADITGDNRITGNLGFGLVAVSASTVEMRDGTISSNTGVGVRCRETSHCEWFGATQIDGNGAGGIEITGHSDAAISGGIDISGNTGIGVLVDLGSFFNSLGGNTINGNTDDGIVVNTLSVLKFNANDTITGNGKLALECDNGSLVVGDVSTYKPKKCGPAFQAKPIS